MSASGSCSSTSDPTLSRQNLVLRTQNIIIGLQSATSDRSVLHRLSELSSHLMDYPECKDLGISLRLIDCILNIKYSAGTVDCAVTRAANRALSLAGYCHPVPGNGIRILSIDGGGTRGLAAIESLKRLEKMCQQPIYMLFDYVCGVSTGALVAAGLFLEHIPVIEMEDMYKRLSSLMFERNKLLGTGTLVWRQAYYDHTVLERVLSDYLGCKLMIDYAETEQCPKVSFVSTIVNLVNPTDFLFRNYNLPPNSDSTYRGTTNAQVWEAIRASSAAPGYYEEYRWGRYVHQDGGLLTNNPAAIAVHEAKMLWPDTPIQCVVSLGNGKNPEPDDLRGSFSTSSTFAFTSPPSPTQTALIEGPIAEKDDTNPTKTPLTSPSSYKETSIIGPSFSATVRERFLTLVQNVKLNLSSEQRESNTDSKAKLIPNSLDLPVSLRNKIIMFVQSATNTEGVHTILQDMLPRSTYFRFNPYLSEAYTLDEVRHEKLVQLQHDAQMYLRRNEYKVNACARRLTMKKPVFRSSREILARFFKFWSYKLLRR